MTDGQRESELSDLGTESYSVWLRSTRKAQQTGEGANVPCGECRGCCTSAYFIHIGPEEAATLARIPKRLAFRAPGLPKGHVLLGYDEKGHCPMFIENQCSIYAQRPRTCRDYDCRVFPATGVAADEDKPRIARQAARWKFAFPGAQDTREYAAVCAAAEFLRQCGRDFPPGFVPAQPTQQAVMALKVYEVFLDKPGDCARLEPAQRREIAAAVVAAFAEFAGNRGEKKGRPAEKRGRPKRKE